MALAVLIFREGFGSFDKWCHSVGDRLVENCHLFHNVAKFIINSHQNFVLCRPTREFRNIFPKVLESILLLSAIVWKFERFHEVFGQIGTFLFLRYDIYVPLFAANRGIFLRKKAWNLYFFLISSLGKFVTIISSL